MNVFIFSNVKNLSNKRRRSLVPNESQPRHKRERSSFFMTIILRQVKEKASKQGFSNIFWGLNKQNFDAFCDF